MAEISVLEIVTEYMHAHGYDGLYSRDECACMVVDLAPCGEMRTDCRVGVKTMCDCGDHDWHIGPEGVGDS